MSARALSGVLACAMLVGSLWVGPSALAQEGPEPQALLDAAWNAADWPVVLAILDTMGASEAVLERQHRAHLNYAWELLAGGECVAAYGHLERALGLLPGGVEAQRGLALARQHCPEAALTQPPVASATPVSAPTNKPAPAAPVAITPQPVSEPTDYTVQRGDTLYSLARRYGLSVAELRQANELSGDGLQAGQAITIPPPQAASGGPATHVVQPGETLYSIARQYGVTVRAIQAANDLESAAIWSGQRLTIPPSGEQAGSAPATGTARTHRVGEGDTLFSLARHYGVTVEAIQQANGLTDTDILVGALLIIP